MAGLAAGPQITIVLIAAGIAHASAARAPSGDPFAFFRPYIQLTSDDRRALDDRAVVVKVLPAIDRDLGIFAAVAVETTPAALVERVRDIASFKRSPFLQAIHRFSSPPRLEDLSALTLPDVDLESIRKCRPGACKVKLGADEILELRRLAQTGRPDWKPAVRDAFRRLVLRRAEAYLAQGHQGLADYRDHERPINLAASFRTILRRSPFLERAMPDFASFLEQFPAPPPEHAEWFLYWSQEKFALKPVVSVTHLALRTSDGRAGWPEVLVASKQVFAAHYADASLGLTALLRGDDGRRYLAYANRSLVDRLEGPLGGLRRAIVERRMREETARMFAMQRDRLEARPIIQLGLEPARRAKAPTGPGRGRREPTPSAGWRPGGGPQEHGVKLPARVER